MPIAPAACEFDRRKADAGDVAPLGTRSRAPVVRLDDFVRRREWADLPLHIKVAMIHVWRAENEPSTPHD
jgi:hypothetical protein